MLGVIGILTAIIVIIAEAIKEVTNNDRKQQ